MKKLNKNHVVKQFVLSTLLVVLSACGVGGSEPTPTPEPDAKVTYNVMQSLSAVIIKGGVGADLQIQITNEYASALKAGFTNNQMVKLTGTNVSDYQNNAFLYNQTAADACQTGMELSPGKSCYYRVHFQSDEIKTLNLPFSITTDKNNLSIPVNIRFVDAADADLVTPKLTLSVDGALVYPGAVTSFTLANDTNVALNNVQLMLPKALDGMLEQIKSTTTGNVAPGAEATFSFKVKDDAVLNDKLCTDLSSNVLTKMVSLQAANMHELYPKLNALAQPARLSKDKIAHNEPGALQSVIENLTDQVITIDLSNISLPLGYTLASQNPTMIAANSSATINLITDPSAKTGNIFIPYSTAAGASYQLTQSILIANKMNPNDLVITGSTLFEKAILGEVKSYTLTITNKGIYDYFPSTNINDYPFSYSNGLQLNSSSELLSGNPLKPGQSSQLIVRVSSSAALSSDSVKHSVMLTGGNLEQAKVIPFSVQMYNHNNPLLGNVITPFPSVIKVNHAVYYQAEVLFPATASESAVAMTVTYPNGFIKDQNDNCFGKVQLLRGQSCQVSGSYTPAQLGDLSFSFTFTPQAGNALTLPINSIVYNDDDQNLLVMTVASITLTSGQNVSVLVSNNSAEALNNVEVKLGKDLSPLTSHQNLILMTGIPPQGYYEFNFDLADDPAKIQAIYNELITNPQTGELSITAANAKTVKPPLSVNANTAKVSDLTIDELNKNTAVVRFDNLTNSALTVTGVSLSATGGLYGVTLKTEGCNATANHQLSANASCNVLFDVTPEAKGSGELVINYKDLNNDQHQVSAKVDVNNQLSPAAITVQSSLLAKPNATTAQTVSEVELTNTGVFIWDAQAATLVTNAEPSSSVVLDNQCVLVQPGSRCAVKVILDNTLTTDPTELTINGSNLTAAKTIALTLTEYGVGLSAQKGFDAYTASDVPLTLHYLLKNEGLDSETIQTVSLPEGFTQLSDEKACLTNMTLTKDQSCEIIAKTNGLNVGDYSGVISVTVVDDKANTHTISANLATIVEDNKTGSNLIDIANAATHYIAAGTTTSIDVDYIPFGNELPLSDFNIVGLPSCLTDNMLSGVNIDNSSNTISFTLKNDQATISALQGCKVALDNNDKAVSDAVMVESSIAKVFQPKFKVKLEPDVAVSKLNINQPVNQTIDIVNYSQAVVDVIDIDVSQLPEGVSMLTPVPSAQTPLTLAVGETKQLDLNVSETAVNQNALESNNLTLSYHYKGGEITNIFTKTVTVTVAGIMPTNFNIDNSVVLPYNDQAQVTNVEVINTADLTWYPSILSIDYYIENQSGFIVNMPVKIAPPKDGALNCMASLLGVSPGASCYIGIEREGSDEAVASYTLVIKGVGAASLSKSNNLIGDARVMFATASKAMSYEVIHDTVTESLPYTPMVQTIKVTNTGDVVINNLQANISGNGASAFEIYNPNSSGTDNGKGSATTNYKGNWCDANFCPASCTSLVSNSLAPAGVCYYYVHAKQDAKEGEKVANITVSANGLTNQIFTLYNKKAIYIRDYKSLDNGVSWISYGQNFKQQYFSMAFNGYGQMYIVGNNKKVEVLKHLNAEWQYLPASLTYTARRIVVDSMSNLWVGVMDSNNPCSVGGLVRSPDNGVTWEENIGNFATVPKGLAAAKNGDIYVHLCSKTEESALKKYDIQSGQWSSFGAVVPSLYVSGIALSNEGVPYVVGSSSGELYVYNSQINHWDIVAVPQEIKPSMFSIIFDSEDQLYLGALESTFPSKFVIGVKQSMSVVNWGAILNGPSVYVYSTPLYPIRELIIESN
ncbi:hypothetical protein [Cysteiniphilum litorale]|uniref:hypothetical protein n=1 Tax=Cysteiniphilum litorale TaxID=2056700 RepID=UPI003F884A21